MHTTGEIFRPVASTPAEFIEEVKTAVTRSHTKSLFGYRTRDDATRSITYGELDLSRVMISPVFGQLGIDDFDAPVTRKDGTTSTPIYELEQPWRWPDGLFDKLVTYTWIIDNPINPLDVIADRV